MKTKIKRTLAVGAVAVAAGTALAVAPGDATAATNHYGAIAISTATGNTAYAINYSSPQAARNAAVARCGAYDCEWVVTMDRNCGAAAQNPVTLRWGWAYGPNRASAENAARNAAGWGSNTIIWACTDH